MKNALFRMGADGLSTSLVHGLWVLQECKCVPEDLSAIVQAALGVVEGVSDVFAFASDGVDLGAELVLGPAFFRCQVQEVALFAVQSVKPLGVLPAHGRCELVVVGYGIIDTCANLSAELFGEQYGLAVVLHNGFF